MAEMKKEVGFLSILRIISAFAVVVIHAVATSVFNYSGDVSDSIVYVLDTVHVYMNWAVPVFFMITGYIFIGLKSECELSKMKKYVLRFLAALFIFGFGYAMLERVYSTHTINIDNFIYAIGDIFTGNLWDHMWYVYEIIGIYIVLPIVKPFTDKSNKNLIYAASVTFVFNILLPFIGDMFGTELAFSIPLVRYMFYIFAGGLIAKLHIPNIKRNRIYSICFLIASICLVWIFYRNGISCAYNSLAICAMALSIFLLFSLIFENCAGKNRIIKDLSSLTWGVYLIHPLVLNVVIKVLHIQPLDYPPYFSIPILCIGVFAVSLLLIFVMKKIPLVKKML